MNFVDYSSQADLVKIIEGMGAPENIAIQVAAEFYTNDISKIETTVTENRGRENAYQQMLWCRDRIRELGKP